MGARHNAGYRGVKRPAGLGQDRADGLTQRFGVDRIAVVDAGIVQRGDERVVDGVCLCWRGEGRGAENARGCRQQSLPAWRIDSQIPELLTLATTID